MHFLRKKIFVLAIVVFVNLTSAWFYRVLNEALLFAALIFAFTAAISFVIVNLVHKKISVLIYSLFIIFTIFFTINNLSKDLFNPSALEEHIIKVRQGYYGGRKSMLINNKYTLFLYKYQRNIFTNLSFNQFFFAGQPRLRPYALDFEKFPLVYVFFFISGLIYLLKLNKKQLITFLIAGVGVLLTVAFADPNIKLGLLPLYPIVGSIISVGLYQLVFIIKNKFYAK